MLQFQHSIAGMPYVVVIIDNYLRHAAGSETPLDWLTSQTANGFFAQRQDGPIVVRNKNKVVDYTWPKRYYYFTDPAIAVAFKLRFGT